MFAFTLIEWWRSDSGKQWGIALLTVKTSVFEERSLIRLSRTWERWRIDFFWRVFGG